MLVTDIEIFQYQYCSKSSRHTASVCMTLKDRVVTLFCRLDLPKDESPRTRAAAFVSEATRQLRRMPEFRSGREKLKFADDLADVRLPQMA